MKYLPGPQSMRGGNDASPALRVPWPVVIRVPIVRSIRVRHRRRRVDGPAPERGEVCVQRLAQRREIFRLRT